MELTWITNLVAIITLIALFAILYYYEDLIFHLYNIFSYTPGRIVKIDRSAGYMWVNVEIENKRYDLIVPYTNVTNTNRKGQLVDNRGTIVNFFPGCESIISLDILGISKAKKPRAKRITTPKKKISIVNDNDDTREDNQDDFKFITIDKSVIDYYDIKK